jgi:hypothetical protein
MGYSIATPIKSEKAKKRMMAFLSRHYDPTFDIYARGPNDNDLSYDHGRCRIGFEGTITSDFMVSMCAWIALKVGKVKLYPTKKIDKVHGPYKYIRYDGYEDWPILVRDTYEADLPQLVKVNWVGCLVPRPSKLDGPLGRTADLARIYEELKRLDELWSQYP